MNYKITTCIYPYSASLEQQIQSEATGNWKFVSHSVYLDPTTNVLNASLVYVLDNKD